MGFKTDTVKNSQNPEWNYGADFVIDGNTPSDIALNIFDQDKLGKDKSLGNAILSVSDLIDRSEDPNAAATWVPLSGVKSGEVLVDTNFVPNDDMDMTRRMSGHGKGKQNAGDPNAKGLAALKKRGSNDDMHGDDLDEIPEGNVHVNLVKAKNLMKSDPYAVVSFDDEKIKTKTVKNNQNPEWNFDLDIPIDADGPRKIKIDVFDKDKIGKDKPLGSACMDVADIQKGNDFDKDWIPLDGVKSGQIQVSTEFLPESELPMRKGSGLGDVESGVSPNSKKNRKDSDMSVDGYGPNSRKPSTLGSEYGSEIPAGKINLNIHEGKDLVKADLIGKSDPYAVVTYGNDKVK